MMNSFSRRCGYNRILKTNSNFRDYSSEKQENNSLTLSKHRNCVKSNIPSVLQYLRDEIINSCFPLVLAPEPFKKSTRSQHAVVSGTNALSSKKYFLYISVIIYYQSALESKTCDYYCNYL